MTRVYQAHQRDLEEQRKQLLREQQYADDLKKLRSTRQHKVLKAFDMLDNGEGDVEEEAGRWSNLYTVWNCISLFICKNSEYYLP